MTWYLQRPAPLTPALSMNLPFEAQCLLPMNLPFDARCPLTPTLSPDGGEGAGLAHAVSLGVFVVHGFNARGLIRGSLSPEGARQRTGAGFIGS